MEHRHNPPKYYMGGSLKNMDNFSKEKMLLELVELSVSIPLLKDELGCNVIELVLNLRSLSKIGEEFERFLSCNKLSMTIILFEDTEKTRFILPLIKTEEPCIDVVSYVNPYFPEYGCIYLPGDVNIVA